MTQTLHVYVVNDCDWVCATDEWDALQAWREHLRNTVGDDPDTYGQVNVEPEPDEKTLRLLFDEDDPSLSSGAKTCAEWANENGRGFLASTEY